MVSTFMRRTLVCASAAASVFIGTQVQAAGVLAECGASYGQAYFDGEAAFDKDQISRGKFEFRYDDKNNLNVFFSNSEGSVTDAAADGGDIVLAFLHKELAEFGVIVVYADAGVVETYTVLFGKDGKRRLFWTTNKSRASVISKVGAYVADCK